MLVTNLREIALNYILGWFFFDLASGVPFSFFMNDSNENRDFGMVTKLAKAPKLYKITKLAKLFRIFKIFSNKKTMMSFSALSSLPGLGRFIYSLLISFTVIHVVSCLWIFVTSFDKMNENWLVELDLNDSSMGSKYTAAFYWTIQTVLTVGYGDIQAKTIEEKIFSCIWMLVGVLVYSFVIGSVSSLWNCDNTQKEQDMKMFDVLAKLRVEYKLPISLFVKAKRAVKNRMKDIDELDYGVQMDSLPLILKNELGYMINKKKLLGVPFFDNKAKDFIATIGGLVKKLIYNKGDIIYYEGDPSNDMYFIKTGTVCAVLKENYNAKYLEWSNGQAFGHIDIICGNDYRKETMLVCDTLEVFQMSKKSFEKFFVNEFQEITKDFIEDAKLQRNLIKNIHTEAKDYFRKDFIENNMKINAWNIDKMMDNIELYSYLFDSDLSSVETKKEVSSNESQDSEFLASKFVIKPGNNPLLYQCVDDSNNGDNFSQRTDENSLQETQIGTSKMQSENFSYKTPGISQRKSYDGRVNTSSPTDKQTFDSLKFSGFKSKRNSINEDKYNLLNISTPFSGRNSCASNRDTDFKKNMKKHLTMNSNIDGMNNLAAIFGDDEEMYQASSHDIKLKTRIKKVRNQLKSETINSNSNSEAILVDSSTKPINNSHFKKYNINKNSSIPNNNLDNNIVSISNNQSCNQNRQNKSYEELDENNKKVNLLNNSLGAIQEEKDLNMSHGYTGISELQIKASLNLNYEQKNLCRSKSNINCNQKSEKLVYKNNEKNLNCDTTSINNFSSKSFKNKNQKKFTRSQIDLNIENKSQNILGNQKILYKNDCKKVLTLNDIKYNSQKDYKTIYKVRKGNKIVYEYGIKNVSKNTFKIDESEKPQTVLSSSCSLSNLDFEEREKCFLSNKNGIKNKLNEKIIKDNNTDISNRTIRCNIVQKKTNKDFDKKYYNITPISRKKLSSRHNCNEEYKKSSLNNIISKSSEKLNTKNSPDIEYNKPNYNKIVQKSKEERTRRQNHDNECKIQSWDKIVQFSEDDMIIKSFKDIEETRQENKTENFNGLFKENSKNQDIVPKIKVAETKQNSQNKSVKISNIAVEKPKLTFSNMINNLSQKKPNLKNQTLSSNYNVINYNSPSTKNENNHNLCNNNSSNSQSKIETKDFTEDPQKNSTFNSPLLNIIRTPSKAQQVPNKSILKTVLINNQNNNEQNKPKFNGEFAIKESIANIFKTSALKLQTQKITPGLSTGVSTNNVFDQKTLKERFMKRKGNPLVSVAQGLINMRRKSKTILSPPKGEFDGIENVQSAPSFWNTINKKISDRAKKNSPKSKPTFVQLANRIKMGVKLQKAIGTTVQSNQKETPLQSKIKKIESFVEHINTFADLINDHLSKLEQDNQQLLQENINLKKQIEDINNSSKKLTKEDLVKTNKAFDLEELRKSLCEDCVNQLGSNGDTQDNYNEINKQNNLQTYSKNSSDCKQITLSYENFPRELIQDNEKTSLDGNSLSKENSDINKGIFKSYHDRSKTHFSDSSVSNELYQKEIIADKKLDTTKSNPSINKLENQDNEIKGLLKAKTKIHNKNTKTHDYNEAGELIKTEINKISNSGSKLKKKNKITDLNNSSSKSNEKINPEIVLLNQTKSIRKPNTNQNNLESLKNKLDFREEDNQNLKIQNSLTKKGNFGRPNMKKNEVGLIEEQNSYNEEIDQNSSNFTYDDIKQEMNSISNSQNYDSNDHTHKLKNNAKSKNTTKNKIFMYPQNIKGLKINITKNYYKTIIGQNTEQQGNTNTNNVNIVNSNFNNSNINPGQNMRHET